MKKKKKISSNTIIIICTAIGAIAGIAISGIGSGDYKLPIFGACLGFVLSAIITSYVEKYKNKKAKRERERKKKEELENLDKEKLDAIVSEIKARTAQPAYRIKMSNSESIGLTDSKFGGLPYWPDNMAYPANKKGEKLILLAQINFGEEKLSDNRLPKHGLLQFYVLGDDLSGADFDDPFSQENFRIVYHAEIDGSVTEESVKALGVKANTDFKDDRESYLPSDDEMIMSFEEMTDCMADCVDGFDALVGDIMKELYGEELTGGAVWKSFNNTEYEYLTEALNETGWGHKLLGYPSFTQWDPRKDNEHQTLLLQIDSQDDIMWGDSGVANFFIDESALKKLDFSDVMYTWDCY